MNSFTRWLRAQQRRDDAIGDLARDAVKDEHWPKGASTLRTFRCHLEQLGACDRAVATLSRARAEYESSRRAPVIGQWQPVRNGAVPSGSRNRNHCHPRESRCR